jgi:hypothetical protein
MDRRFILIWCSISFFLSLQAMADVRSLDSRMHHLRNGAREWSEFPEKPESAVREVRFAAKKNTTEFALRVRQQDVKQTWTVSLNGKVLGKLTIDENDMVLYFSIPPGGLNDGENVLRIEQPGQKPVPDDIRVGDIVLYDRPTQEVLQESKVSVEVLDAELGTRIPCRITIVTHDGALQSVGAQSQGQLAVRPGVVYSSSGLAQFGLPVGRYTVYAGRGFEYSLSQAELSLTAGDSVQQTLRIRREVPTEGYVACDTHVHTLTHSGHGDATIQERMVTLAGEGIELPIATDHNVQIDFDPIARELHVRQHFTPVIGNEVTTKVGHFNVFPIPLTAPPPDFKLNEWGAIFADIERLPGQKAIILNHARDVHSGTRPFGPQLHNAVVGENLNGWPMRFNAMEVINSGATQNDLLRLCHDWMGLLNRGRIVTPVGSSDSHDVARHFVGQGRTYIRTNDRDPGQINVGEAVKSFLQGRVMVSYGLLAELTVNDKSSGELVSLPAGKSVTASLRVLAPHWISANRVLLFANGQKIRDEAIGPETSEKQPTGVKGTMQWELDRPRHDIHLVAIALGPGIRGSYWKTAKPYQPTSPDWEPQVIGCSGAVWLDADGDGRKTAAYDYAQRLFMEAKGEFPKLIASLADFDQSVASQAAHLYQTSGGNLLSDESQRILASASDSTQEGVRRYLDAWRENQMARQ